ncbi:MULTISPECIES: helix-turn-helix domain-containing protein [Actinosynnema]|uniref:helix-turn-helix domain-containing protein n=1 Tax=Actinosynnema TaxID=40566 RepID=UPI00264671CF|nr:helix-turn-helix domain-containing protein [Actinosynnema pretiosum]
MERRVLLRWARGGEPIALRAQIILFCSEGVTSVETAKRLGVSRETVRKWRGRFQEDRIGGLTDRPRSGSPRTIGEECVRCVVAATLELPAPGGGRWTTRAMASARGLSQTAVSRIWRDADLRPELVAAWRLVLDPGFVARVRGVRGVLLAPGGGALALAVRATARRAPEAPAGGCAVVRTCADSPWSKEFAPFLDAVDAVAGAEALHVLCSDERVLATYPVRHWLARRPRHRCAATPAAARWSVLLERWLDALAGLPGQAELRDRVRAADPERPAEPAAPWPPAREGDRGLRACPCRTWG